MASKGKKPVADSFSSSQPGYISVAGESFFLNLPTDDANTLESRLHDDSIKGDVAFQRLYLGDKSKEEDKTAPFTKQEQIDLRRIFRAIFGVGSGPTKKGIALPCSKKDLNLMLKALEIRRKNLIAQINTYDALASPDVHAKYMREHLIRLNKLIGEEIPETLAPCKLTDVIDPNAPPRLPLDDARMLRLLEIFAYLLAQGKDPLSTFQKTQPQPTEILPKMAVKDAPGLKEYEDEYSKANPHKVPEYTETLLKIKKILQGDVTTGDKTVDKQVQQAFEAIEKALGITDTSGSYSDRADRVIKRITAMGEEKRADIADLMKARSDLAKKQEEYDSLFAKEKACQEELTKVKGEKSALEANVAKLTTDLAAANDKLKRLEAGLAAANESIKKLEEALAAATEAKAAAEKALTAANEAKAAAEAALAAANEAKAAAEAALAAATATIAALQKDLADANTAKETAEAALAAANKTIANLNAELAEARSAEAAVRAEVGVLTRQKAALEESIAGLNADIQEKDVEITELTRQLNEKKAQLNALLEIVPELNPTRLRELLDAEGLVDTLNEQIADLRRQLAACPPAEELRRLQGLVDELGRRPTQEAYDTLQATVNDLRRQVQEQTEVAESLQPFGDLVRQLEGLLNDELTPERFAELLRAEESIAGLRARIQELEGRPDITQEDLDELRTQLRNALAQITELEKRPDISQEDYDALVAAHTAAKALIETLEKRAPITPEELQGLKDDLDNILDKYEKTVEDLDRRTNELETARAIIKRLQEQRNELQKQLDAALAKLAECEETKKKLANTQLQLVAEQTKVRNLEAKILALEEKIKKATGDATTIQRLTDEKSVVEAVRDKALSDLAAAQGNVKRLEGELATAISERDARPTAQQLQEMTEARNAAIAERNARPTAQQLQEMTEARNAAIAERNARPTPEALAEVKAERNAAVATTESLKARVARLEEQIRTGGVYKVVYTRLKEILNIRDGIDLPNEGQVDDLLRTVQEKIRGAPSAEVNKSNLCLLNMLYILLRRMTSKQGITTNSGLKSTPEQVQGMYQSIIGKSTTPINDQILFLFLQILKKLLSTGIPRAGEFVIYSDLELPMFTPIYTDVSRLLETAPFFTNENKACASAFLNQFFMNEYDFTMLYLKSNGRLKMKVEGEDLGLVNLASLFLLVLTATQQVIDTNKAAIDAAGCSFQFADLKPEVPVPVKVEAALTEEQRCKHGTVPGTNFKRQPMPGPVLFERMRTQQPEELRKLFTYLEYIRESDPPIGPLCKVSIAMLPSEYDTHTKLVNLFTKRPPWHVALQPYKKNAPRVDPSSVKPIAGVPTRYGGTRKRKAVNKQKTKKIRKT
jgi:predicted  nucleic acid-binding Zn-ribbon protein